MKINEWIGFDVKNKWWLEVKQDDLNYYSDIYTPWQTKQRLKIGREVEWASKTLYFTFASGTALWVQSYTGFWFTPSAYVIDAWLNDSNSSICISKGTRFNWVNWWYSSYPSTYNSTSTRAIWIYSTSAWTTRTRAIFSKFIKWGVELDFTDNALNIAFTITAFK